MSDIKINSREMLKDAEKIARVLANKQDTINQVITLLKMAISYEESAKTAPFPKIAELFEDEARTCFKIATNLILKKEDPHDE